MDVTLDANIYLSDPRMEGIAFKSLLDYLRKTQSKLIIPKLVLDEVIARYPERLLAQAKRTISSTESLRSLVFVAKVKRVPKIDGELESRAFKSRLIRPSKYVKSTLLKDFRRIDIKEIAKRGIQRIPPASAAGEELRDVISWLMVLNYAEASRREVAFITKDEHFARAGVLHQQLTNEVQDRKIKLRFYESIDDFIKAHAPAPHDLSADRAFAFISKQLVLDHFEIEMRSLFPRYWRDASSFDVISREIEFRNGALYDVGPDSQYGEMTFSGNLRVRVTTQHIAPVANVFGTSLASLSGGQWTPPHITTPYSTTAVLLGDKAPEPEFWMSDFPANTQLSSLKNRILSPVSNVVPRFIEKIPTTTSAAEFNVSGRLIVSMRLVSGKITNLETEKFEPGEISHVREGGDVD